MQDAGLPGELTELVARSVLSTYTSLPSNGKPKRRSNGAPEWTVLAGFCLFERDERAVAGWNVGCVALGTGLKVLPHAKLPLHGDVLHDSHAEVIARRGLLLWLYDQLERASQSEESALRRSGDKWGLREGLQLGMYVSTLPCGDASTYSLSLVAAPSPPSRPSAAPTLTEQLPSSLLATSLGLQVSRSVELSVDVPLVHRGRVSYSSYSSLRTKPGRLDSPPTTSHSCSDKLAMWTAVGLQGALLSALRVEQIRFDLLVVGGVASSERHKVKEEVERAISGRLGGWGCVEAPTVAFTDMLFDAARDVVAESDELEEAEILSCPESLSYIASQGIEVLVNGIRQGAKSKRRGGEPLGSKSRSRLSKLALFKRYTAIASSLGLEVATSICFETKRTATAYQSRKEAVRAVGAPLNGWIVSGRPWESFGVDGTLVEQRVETSSDEACGGEAAFGVEE